MTSRVDRTLPDSLALDRVLSAGQCAELCGVSLATFRRQHRIGRLPPPIRFSERRLGWRVRDLLEHLSKQTGAAA
jgi:predicted DNA-binding transcriptional regulator AlpA